MDLDPESSPSFIVGDITLDLLVYTSYDNYGIASKGFNIVSCQFALHYFFKDKATLKNFMINLVECTALNGIFIVSDKPRESNRF